MDINIKTTLGVNTSCKPKELLAITRGASFLLTYKLDISYDIVSQVIFTFKQNQKLFYYNMFHYLTSTSDTKIEKGKKYYNITPISTGTDHECTAELVIYPEDNPQDAGYYEEVDTPADNQNGLPYFIDEHFKYEKETNTVLFMFFPAETARFSPTTPGAEIKFEVAVRVNTDNRDDLVNHDAVYIDKQPGIIVKDSLYGQVLSDTNTAAGNPEWLASPRRTVKVSSGTLTIGNTTVTEEQLQQLLALLKGQPHS